MVEILTEFKDLAEIAEFSPTFHQHFAEISVKVNSVSADILAEILAEMTAVKFGGIAAIKFGGNFGGVSAVEFGRHFDGNFGRKSATLCPIIFFDFWHSAEISAEMLTEFPPMFYDTYRSPGLICGMIPGYVN